MELEHPKGSSTLRKIDSLLLSVGTILSISFSIIETFIKGILRVFYFLSSFSIIFLIPIWIGYVRGSIRFDIIEERVRGWIYLLGGVTGYLTFFLLNNLFNILVSPISPTRKGFLQLIVIILTGIGLVPLGVIFSFGIVGERLLKFLYKRLGRDKIPEVSKTLVKYAKVNSFLIGIEAYLLPSFLSGFQFSVYYISFYFAFFLIVFYFIRQIEEKIERILKTSL